MGHSRLGAGGVPVGTGDSLRGHLFPGQIIRRLQRGPLQLQRGNLRLNFGPGQPPILLTIQRHRPSFGVDDQSALIPGGNQFLGRLQ